MIQNQNRHCLPIWENNVTLVTFLSVIYYLGKHVMITNDDEFNYIGQKVTFRRLVANKISHVVPL